MKLTFVTASLLCSLAAAAPHDLEPKGHDYQREKPGDSRSPCPGLNALANHGWLPRSGKNISLENVRRATGYGFNYAPHVFDDAVGAVFLFNLSTSETPDLTFNLDDLGSAAAHDTVEFDGSLSRNDFLVSRDALNFNKDIWDPVAHDLGLKGENAEEAVVTIEAAANARTAREKAARGANPHFNASELQVDGSPGATGLYLTTLWEDEKDGAPKAWVKALFEEERIAYREGFKVSSKVKTSDTLKDMIEAVVAVPV